MGKLAVAIFVALAFASPGGARSASGLVGRVMRGPVTPVCHAGSPCSRPAARVTLQFVLGTAVVASATTATDGTFRVSLAAGSYGVRVASVRPSRMMRLAPARVVVQTAAWTTANFMIDTGIR